MPALALAMVLSGCIPARRPPPMVPAVSPEATWTERGEPVGDIDTSWWRRFGDPTLNQMVERALVNNTNVVTAIAQVDEAEARVRLARSALLPSVDARLDAITQREPNFLGLNRQTTAVQGQGLVSWQPDLFGRLRAGQRAAKALFVASQADRDAVRLAVASQLAQAYVTVIALDAQIVVTRRTIAIRREFLRIAQDRAQVGYSSQFELTQAQSEYEAVTGQLPDLERGVRNAENAVSLLIGDPPSHSFARGSIAKILLPPIPLVMPSELLQRRPDLAAAEARLIATDETLTAQRRAFLPSVTLSGSVGQLLVNGLNYDPATIWTIGSSILGPIFHGGRLRANVDVATAQRDQAAYAYRSTTLVAFADVENSLTDVRRYAEQLVIVQRQRTVLSRSLALARDRYDGGYASYLEQLDAQRNLYTAELSAISTRQAQLQATIRLADALGGGWVGQVDDP